MRLPRYSASARRCLLPSEQAWHADGMNGPRVYLDYNATAPLASEVSAAMEPWFAGTAANPASVHRDGQRARAAVETARQQVKELCGGHDVIFTSGGTEADNLAITGLLGLPPRGHLVVSAIEHPAVLQPANALAAFGVDTTLVPVDAQGRVDPDAVAAALREDTVLISIMAANNETGTIQPIRKVATIARHHNIHMHCDAVQAAAWLDLHDLLDEVDLVTLSGHKIGGPPGIGALVLRRPLDLTASLRGGGQQNGRRAGTEPTALIAGFGAACERARMRYRIESERVGTLASNLVAAIIDSTLDVYLTVPTAPRLPNTIHLCFADCPGDLLVACMDLENIAASAGSACASGVAHASHVLQALNLPRRYQSGAIRLSMGYGTDRQQTTDLGERIVRCALAATTGNLPEVGG